MKDNYRKMEQNSNRRYWYMMIAITVLIFATCIVSCLIGEHEGFLLSKAIINMVILCLQSIVLRIYIDEMYRFLRLMKEHHFYEYKIHIRRETIILVCISSAFLMIDAANLWIFSFDFVNLTCKRFNDTLAEDGE